MEDGGVRARQRDSEREGVREGDDGGMREGGEERTSWKRTCKVVYGEAAESAWQCPAAAVVFVVRMCA